MYQHLPPFKIALLFGLAFAFITAALLYVLTLHNTLLAIAPQNRKINANAPFLQFAVTAASIALSTAQVRYMPSILNLVSLCIQLFVMKRINRSLNVAFSMGGVPVNSEAVYITGIAFLLLCALSDLIDKLPGPLASTLGGLLFIVGNILWIIYWIGIARCKNKLKRMPVFEPGSSQIF